MTQRFVSPCPHTLGSFAPRVSALLALLFTLLTASPFTLYAQTDHPIAVQAEYTWIHANILPNCNCFGMNGGSGELQYGLNPKLSVLFDITIIHSGGLTPSGYSLTQSAFTGGLRYTPDFSHSRLHSFGELLLGAAHASGTLAPQLGGYGDNTAFAFQSGGGLSLHLNQHLTLIPAHIDYLLTTFANGQANHQNQLRLSAGLQLHLHH